MENGRSGNLEVEKIRATQGKGMINTAYIERLNAAFMCL
jgi:hypothetical protein